MQEKNKRAIIILISCILGYGCSPNSGKATEANFRDTTAILNKENESTANVLLEEDSKSIGNTIGFITIPYEIVYQEEDIVEQILVLNEDHSLWMSFSPNYERNRIENDNFKPWAYEPGIGVFAIRCTGKTKDGYTIVVNEDLQLEKHLQNHPSILFSTIQEHLLHILVGTDFNLNPIRKNPDKKAPMVTIEPGELIKAIEVEGDWIRIKNIETEQILGWIKWRNGDKFMISMSYSV